MSPVSGWGPFGEKIAPENDLCGSPGRREVGEGVTSGAGWLRSGNERSVAIAVIS